MQIGETRHYVCIPCYNDPRAETVDIDGINYPKLKLEKRKNDEETEEPVWSNLLLKVFIDYYTCKSYINLMGWSGSGYNVTSVKNGNIKSVHCSICGEMMVAKLSIHVHSA
jgi:hypothetical protein